VLSRSVYSENQQCCRHTTRTPGLLCVTCRVTTFSDNCTCSPNTLSPPFFCLCMCLIYSFIFTSFLLFLLSIVSSFLHPLYKSPSIHSSLTDSFSLFYLLFLSSISCVQFLPLFFFCSSLISFLLSLPLYLVFLLFLLTSLLSFILFCPCNLFVPVAAFLLFFFLLIFVTFSSFVFR